MKNQQGGFTLIELIMVIVILGILAAVAIPKFADLSGDAKRASINALAGSMKAASAIAHSAYLVSGQRPATVTLEGTDIALVLGYPTNGGIKLAAQIEDANYDFNVNTGMANIKGDSNAATCKVTYTKPTGSVAAGIVAPTFEIVDTGC
ncbi:MAG: type II secretion system protein [Pseudomonas sp.]